MEDKADIEKYIRGCIDTSRYFRNFGFKYSVFNIFHNSDTNYISCDLTVYGPFVQLYRITIKGYRMRAYTSLYRMCTQEIVNKYVPVDQSMGIIEEDEDFVI